MLCAILVGSAHPGMGSLGVKIQIKIKTSPTKHSGLAQPRLSQSCTHALSLSLSLSCVVVVCSRAALVLTMSSKHSAPSTPGSSEKRRRKVLTLAAKMDATGKKFGLHEATVRTIYKTREKIRQSVWKSADVSSKVASVSNSKKI